MPKVMPVSELQKNFKSVLDACEESGEPIYLTRNGSASVVVMSADAFDKEMSVHESVHDREMRVQKAVMRGIDDFEAGRYTDLYESLAKAESMRGTIS